MSGIECSRNSTFICSDTHVCCSKTDIPRFKIEKRPLDKTLVYFLHLRKCNVDLYSKKELLMKIATKIILVLFLGLFVSVNLMAQKPADLAGTWIGPATAESEAEPNELTLILMLEEGKLGGHMTGQYGVLNEAALYDITLSDGIFKFSVKAYGPSGEELPVSFEMKVDGDSMKGTLDIPDMGISGTWEATKTENK
jgi:hypothetical protein